MATFQSVFAPGSNPDVQTASLAATTSTGDIILGNRQIIALTVSGDAFVRFGNSATIINASATDRPIWAKSYQQYDMGDEFDRIRIFNNGATSINYWVFSIVRGK